jgi:hypothetical protein
MRHRARIYPIPNARVTSNRTHPCVLCLDTRFAASVRSSVAP